MKNKKPTLDEAITILDDLYESWCRGVGMNISRLRVGEAIEVIEEYLYMYRQKEKE